MNDRIKELGDRLIRVLPPLSEDQRDIVFTSLELAEVYGEKTGLKEARDIHLEAIRKADL